jgi:heptosyltransferase-2
MYPITPDGQDTVTHDSLGKERINPNKIFEKFNKILN